MAHAGYCSQCGTYVYMRPDGYCVNGHAPGSVSGHYEAPDEHAPPAAFGVPAPTAAPRKKRTGCLVAAIIVLLLMCCGSAVAAVMFGLLPNPADLVASPEHQKVAAAGDFIEAFSTANAVLFRKALPTEAANAADPAFWMQRLSQADAGRLESKSWTNDELTMVFVSRSGEQQRFTITAVPGSDKVRTVMVDPAGDSSAGSTAMLEMVREPGGYKVLALLDDSGEEFTRFTPEQIKEFESENR